MSLTKTIVGQKTKSMVTFVGVLHVSLSCCQEDDRANDPLIGVRETASLYRP